MRNFRMNWPKRMLWTGLLYLGVNSLIAQDIHFSQFYMAPSNLNPGLTGVFNGSDLVIVNYRNQWAPVISTSAYNTYNISYSKRFLIADSDYIGIGGNIWNDVAGNPKYGTTAAKLALSMSKKIGGRRYVTHYLSLGADVSYAERRIRSGDYRWLTQHNPITATYDPGFGTSENLPSDNVNYIDLTGGLVWYSNWGNRKNWYAGVALHHINTPHIAFADGNLDLYQRLTVHTGAEYPINGRMSGKTNVIFVKQGPHAEWNTGISLRYAADITRRGSRAKAPEGSFFEFGLWYRLASKLSNGLQSDALILAARFDYNIYGIGISYDWNVSSLRQNNPANGSIEISLSYRLNNLQGRGIACPVF